MSDSKIQELDKRLSAHEAACDQRWKENYRRLDSIEAAVKSVNRSIRGVLIFMVVTLLGIVGYFLNLVITFNIN